MTGSDIGERETTFHRMLTFHHFMGMSSAKAIDLERNDRTTGIKGDDFIKAQRCMAKVLLGFWL